VLFWNADTTRMSAALHADFVDVALDNSIARPGALTVRGVPVDLSRVELDTYLVAGVTDHLTPWEACYRSTQLLGGTSRFVLSTSGHIAALVNPPGNPKATYRVNTTNPRDPEAWLGPPPEGLTREAGLERLVRRYLGGFGPSTRKEVADFAGLQPKELTSTLDRMELRVFRAEDGAELVDVPRLPIADADTPAPVRFLPVWDATLLVHARRTQILPEEHRSRIFSVRTPHSVNTFLVDGAVAGTWRYEDGRVRTEPFGRLDRATTRALREEAERLAAFCA